MRMQSFVLFTLTAALPSLLPPPCQRGAGGGRHRDVVRTAERRAIRRPLRGACLLAAGNGGTRYNMAALGADQFAGEGSAAAAAGRRVLQLLLRVPVRLLRDRRHGPRLRAGRRQLGPRLRRLRRHHRARPRRAAPRLPPLPPARPQGQSVHGHGQGRRRRGEESNGGFGFTSPILPWMQS